MSIDLVGTRESVPAGPVTLSLADVRMTTRVTGNQRRLRGGEILDVTPLDLPETTLAARRRLHAHPSTTTPGRPRCADPNLSGPPVGYLHYMYTLRFVLAGSAIFACGALVACGAEPATEDAGPASSAVTATPAPGDERGQRDAWAAAHAPYSSGTDEQAYAYHRELCETLRSGETEGNAQFPAMSSAQFVHDVWGVGNAEWPEEDLRPEVMETVVVPTLCPDQQQVLDDAHAGRFEKALATEFGTGRFVVGEEIRAGTYTIREPVSDCHWERTDSRGNVLDSATVSAAPSLTVTIPESDALFESMFCGNWVLAE